MERWQVDDLMRLWSTARSIGLFTFIVRQNLQRLERGEITVRRAIQIMREASSTTKSRTAALARPLEPRHREGGNVSNRMKLTREALYDLVWSEPISKVAPKLGVSDVALSKICGKLDVPRPPRGYWARLAHGHSVSKPPLPKLKQDVPTEYELAPPAQSRPARIGSDAEVPMVTVKDRVTRYDPIVAELRSRLTGSWTDQYGRIGSCSRVTISKASVARACRILDALVRALRARTIAITLDEQGLAVPVASEAIRVGLHEPSTRKPPNKQSQYGYPRWEYVPSGRLSLSLWSPYLSGYQTKWSDGPNKSLEERLGEIVLVFEHSPSVIAEAKEKERRERLAWERAELCRRRRSDAYEYMEARAQKVDEQVRNLSKAAEIRTFVKAVQNAPNPPAAIRRLARWAALYADHLDPLVDYRLARLDEKLHPRRW